MLREVAQTQKGQDTQSSYVKVNIHDKEEEMDKEKEKSRNLRRIPPIKNQLAEKKKWDPKEIEWFVSYTCLTLSSFSLVLVKRSIQDCPYDEEWSCAQFLNQFAEEHGNWYLLVGLNFGVIINLWILKKVNFYVGIIIFVSWIYFVAFFDREISMTHYGGAITAFIGIATILFIIILFILFGYYKTFTKTKIVFLLLIIITLGSVYYTYTNSCNDWQKGLMDKKLDQSNEYCTVLEPKVCHISLLQYVLDVSAFTRTSCQSSQGTKNFYLRYFKNIRNDDRYLVYPKTNEFSEIERVTMLFKKNNFQFTLFERGHAVTSLEEGFANGSEVILDMNEMKYHINVTRNETLANERQEKAQNWPHEPYGKKIMIIYIDALSRSSFHRQMPRTQAWLEQREQTQKGKNVEFFRMYSLKPFTYPNFLSLQFEAYANEIFDQNEEGKFPCQDGENLKMIDPNAVIEVEIEGKPIYSSAFDDSENSTHHKETKKFESIFSNNINLTHYDSECSEKYKEFNDRREWHLKRAGKNEFKKKWQNIFKDLKEAGYIVGRTPGTCYSSMSMIFYEDLEFSYDMPADHEAMAFACDPNYEDPFNAYGLFVGPSSVLKRCLNQKSVSEHMIEYGKKFWEAYKEDRTFFMFEFLDSHEPSGTVIQYLDDPLVEFLEDLDSKGMLDDTLLLFVSDHGNHMHMTQNFFKSQQYLTERMMPFFNINFPKYFESTHPEFIQNVESNQQKLVTHRNTHFFLQAWIKGEQYAYYNQSFFNPALPANITCDTAVESLDQTINTFGWGLYEAICTCVDPTGDFIQSYN